MGRLRVLTWHVHGSYLESLGAIGHEILVPVRPGRPEGYRGRPPDADWPPSIREVPAEEVGDIEVDVVLFQARRNWLEDQWAILSPRQRRGPRIYLEHDPPREHPTDTRHVVDDPDVTIVHVTAFNELMWDSGASPTRVIEHGVTIPAGVTWTGERARGIVVVNHLVERGRRVGFDVVRRVAAEVPLDLVGMGSEALGGRGEVRRHDLAGVEAPYRFFFHPARYTSFGMAVCEAMLLGMPIVALATTEMPTVVENGMSGYVDTSVPRLVEAMQGLIEDPDLARRLGDNARRVAEARFGIDRFRREWDAVLHEVTGTTTSPDGPVPAAAEARA